ncbi:serine/threonine-protein phosphatase 7 long form homolog [Apium graveolens]|uniref:serine/threonine-protein phosphatase 7 long form homolog n=1 Tax=Apium graveolens TaxID=4045 RepID=UPI003D79BD62
MRHDAGLITAFLDRWRPETHTFHLRFSEATITLQDVYYILGLRSSGHPVSFTAGEIFDASSIHEVLGVDPETGVIVSNNIKIGWLVQEFGDYTRLEEATDPDYDDQLLFHIRAHLLLIIESLFPNSSGNRISLHLLPYVRDLDQIGTFSWGNVCLAYLYSRLCISSIGNVVELCGPMTLLQVWIYEHFSRLAPRHRGNYIMRHPRALRWMVPVEAVHVQRHSARGVRYKLDHMVESSFIWIPYVDCAPQAHDIPADELQLMSAPSPLIYIRVMEWCYTDRVTRQFGFLQRIPTASLHIGHHTFHGSISRWHLSMETVIELWEHQHEGIIAAPTYMPSRRPMSVDGYRTWYDRAEGLSNAYHEIQSSEVAADDPIVDSALQSMEVTLDDTGYHVLQEKCPHPPPTVPTGRRRPRTRGGSTSAAFPHPRTAPLDGYVPWGHAMASDGSA